MNWLLNTEKSIKEALNGAKEDDILYKLFEKDYPIIQQRQSETASYPRSLYLIRPLTILPTVRTLGRYVVPVLWYKGRAICRSATLARSVESIYRSICLADWPIDRRDEEVALLKELKVTDIYDLMTGEAHSRWGIYLTSSERLDSTYQDFRLHALPYPGVESFAKPPAQIIPLTQLYLKQLLFSLETSDGILIHCIAGLDRTPLFVSLLRISLWADGLAHASLPAEELLYLTILYDWLLFDHPLVKRREQGYDIFAFSFRVLEYIEGNEFSLNKSPNRSERLRAFRTAYSLLNF